MGIQPGSGGCQKPASPDCSVGNRRPKSGGLRCASRQNPGLLMKYQSRAIHVPDQRPPRRQNRKLHRSVRQFCGAIRPVPELVQTCQRQRLRIGRRLVFRGICALAPASLYGGQSARKDRHGAIRCQRFLLLVGVGPGPTGQLLQQKWSRVHILSTRTPLAMSSPRRPTGRWLKDVGDGPPWPGAR